MKKGFVIYLIAAALLVAAGLAAYYLYLGKNFSGSAGGISETFMPAKQRDENKQLLESPLSEARQYSDPEFGFSIMHPQAMNVGKFEEGLEGQTVLVQKPGTKIGFQIYITPFEEDIVLTADRIKKDIPDLAVSRAEQFSVGGAAAVSFLSESPSFGKTREVWFVKAGSLYQITTYAELTGFLKEILKTWKFEN